MKVKYFIIYLVFTSIFFLDACKVNDSIDDEYSQSIVENDIDLYIKNGTVDIPGEFLIVNNSNKTIFIPYILYPYCNFSNYSLEKKIDTVWEKLSYNEDEDIWLNNRDSVIAVCQMVKHPVELLPSKMMSQTISKIEEEGEYRLIVYYRYSTAYGPDFPNNKLIIDYTVN